MPNPTASGSDSASGRSSNTGTYVSSRSQEEGPAADMVAMAAHQAVLPAVGGPHPPRRRQRKPNRRAVKSEAAVTSPIKKRGRRPKAAGSLTIASLLYAPLL